MLILTLDEKIKISSRKNPFVIERFLLGHSEFVTRVNFVGDSVVTTGGDGNVKFWGAETKTKEFGKENVVFGLSTALGNLSFAVTEMEKNENSKIFIGKDLDNLQEVACSTHIPLDSCAYRFEQNKNKNCHF